ncbi:hypothetical protein PPACK8108_LOCUS22222 [Phakopsora pachyrhizi]|uniref:Uncharacterized protein n=1 Tax=Phakopsora pachyrhizi TaxID=170000 RepID=A0AAV0BMP0_PHAPC|nr:hypothetical protein PPACK8108_LOCUS22222 [Phakopsora pachyrhizi]
MLHDAVVGPNQITCIPGAPRSISLGITLPALNRQVTLKSGDQIWDAEDSSNSSEVYNGILEVYPYIPAKDQRNRCPKNGSEPSQNDNGICKLAEEPNPAYWGATKDFPEELNKSLHTNDVLIMELLKVIKRLEKDLEPLIWESESMRKRILQDQEVGEKTFKQNKEIRVISLEGVLRLSTNLSSRDSKEKGVGFVTEGVIESTYNLPHHLIQELQDPAIQVTLSKCNDQTI